MDNPVVPLTTVNPRRRPSDERKEPGGTRCPPRHASLPSPRGSSAAVPVGTAASTPDAANRCRIYNIFSVRNYFLFISCSSHGAGIRRFLGRLVEPCNPAKEATV